MSPAESAGRPAIVVAGDDLLFSSRIAAALDSLGYRPLVVRTLDALVDALAEAPAAAILNLASVRLDAIAAIRRAKTDTGTRRVPLLGFCGHADVSLQAAARAAGCDLVASNGEVTGNLSRLLKTLLTAPQPQTSTQ
jgi:DNA-binding response OmpR family regulator